MNKLCKGHKVWMLEKISHTKYDENGNYKHYWSHYDSDGKICFGIKGEEEEKTEEIKEAVETFSPETEKEEDIDDNAPMTKKDWNIKGFEKSFGVYSSPARAEGMSPKQAIESMHLWEWLDAIHLDDLGYVDWKRKVNERIALQEK